MVDRNFLKLMQKKNGPMNKIYKKAIENWGAWEKASIKWDKWSCLCLCMRVPSDHISPKLEAKHPHSGDSASL